MACHGPDLGLRTATTAERLRAHGFDGYELAQYVRPERLTVAVGCVFDPDAILTRAGHPLLAWVNGDATPGGRPPAPSVWLRRVAQLHARAKAVGMQPAADHPRSGVLRH